MGFRFGQAQRAGNPYGRHERPQPLQALSFDRLRTDLAQRGEPAGEGGHRPRLADDARKVSRCLDHHGHEGVERLRAHPADPDEHVEGCLNGDTGKSAMSAASAIEDPPIAPLGACRHTVVQQREHHVALGWLRLKVRTAREQCGPRVRCGLDLEPAHVAYSAAMDEGRGGKDWFEWHRPYDVPGSSLAVRLGLVRAHLTRALDEAPAGEIRIVSMCAGQGRDVIGAVRAHPRRGDVRARLIELDARNAVIAREMADEADLGHVEVVTGDASLSDAYLGAAPAHVVLACGIFGNISDEDIRRCVGLLPMLCESGATVIWTRHRRPPDLTPEIRRWFAAAGFEEVGWDEPADLAWVGAGAVRWPGERGAVRGGLGFFDFLGDHLPPP